MTDLGYSYWGRANGHMFVFLDRAELMISREFFIIRTFSLTEEDWQMTTRIILTCS